ncbi:phosphate acyltransferase PlsX [Fodinicurvata sp. EGI_FJ10296]|uniref:phosphate acyltransferase PlsX n=1 Tax=Fodinicurvata sp. EGI_FJ10296 TaxID=3231908 RepID=UPI003455FCEF
MSAGIENNNDTYSGADTSLTVALDAMGGDNAPECVISGAEIALSRYPDISFLIFGDEKRLRPLIDSRQALAAVSQIRHTDEFVTNDAKPSVALRSGRQSSMRLAIDAVSAGEASCVVSAGNTGALMAMAKYVLKTLPGIDRPAIAAIIPTQKGESVLLDLGANVECKSGHLAQFAVMGALFSKAVLGTRTPTIGLLNVGAEALKGSEVVREAAAILQECPLPGRFDGFVEGNDITAGVVDVVVTDGFTGNVALKTAEGTAKLYAEWMKQTLQSSLMARIGYLFARSAFRKLRVRADPRRYNGAMFLGLRGICVKSHGGTDATGFANAIGVAADLAQNSFNAKVIEEFQRGDFGSLIDSNGAAKEGVASVGSADVAAG